MSVSTPDEGNKNQLDRNATKRILLISKCPPYGSSSARDMLDIALTCSVFEQSVSLLFLGDGVLQLLKNQNPLHIGQKNLNALQSSLAMYDIEKIYVDDRALAFHGIALDDLHLNVTCVKEDTLKALIREHDVVFTL